MKRKREKWWIEWDHFWAKRLNGWPIKCQRDDSPVEVRIPRSPCVKRESIGEAERRYTPTGKLKENMYLKYKNRYTLRPCGECCSRAADQFVYRRTLTHSLTRARTHTRTHTRTHSYMPDDTVGWALYSALPTTKTIEEDLSVWELVPFGIPYMSD